MGLYKEWEELSEPERDRFIKIKLAIDALRVELKTMGVSGSYDEYLSYAFYDLESFITRKEDDEAWEAGTGKREAGIRTDHEQNSQHQKRNTVERDR